MSDVEKLHQGAAAWFQMVGSVMCEAASKAGLAPDTQVSFVERYTDGDELSPGLVQGLRFTIEGGTPSFQVGVPPGAQADVVIEVTAAAARELNRLRSTDPAYEATRLRYLDTGEMRVSGDVSRLGAWLGAVHDTIVARTN